MATQFFPVIAITAPPLYSIGFWLPCISGDGDDRHHSSFEVEQVTTRAG